MSHRFFIDPDIKKAQTLPASFYRDAHIFEELKEKIFMRSWLWMGDEGLAPLPGSVYPFVLLENFLNEPLLLTRDNNDLLRCLSNVCTHRGNLVVQNPGRAKSLTCLYHGRKFAIDGTFKKMPEFEETLNFPRTCEDLISFPLEKLGPHLFVGLQPAFEFASVPKIMSERIAFLPLHEFRLDETLSKDYLINCHWALYCDNYLEGFHIPFVHEDLNKVIDYGSYATEIYDHLNLQIGYSDKAQEVFDLPDGHKDHGKYVAAYYYWIFPNMMFNFYPWGLSINIVRPITLHKTRVSFITYVWDESKLNAGAGALLDKVEREDEFVVENVHKGLQSRFYKAGRFSPTREKGVHHFHSLLARYLK